MLGSSLAYSWKRQLYARTAALVANHHISVLVETLMETRMVLVTQLLAGVQYARHAISSHDSRYVVLQDVFGYYEAFQVQALAAPPALQVRRSSYHGLLLHVDLHVLPHIHTGLWVRAFAVRLHVAQTWHVSVHGRPAVCAVVELCMRLVAHVFLGSAAVMGSCTPHTAQFLHCTHGGEVQDVCQDNSLQVMFG